MNNQDQFWSNEFGKEYHDRNVNLEKNNEKLFRNIFNNEFEKYSYYLDGINSIIEFGAGTGQNLVALRNIFQNRKIDAVELNKEACEKIIEKGCADRVFNKSIFEHEPHEKYDLVLTKGLLIHIAPEYVNTAYNILYNSSKRYILICEYYNPKPISIEYRGNFDKLWKRDYCSEIIMQYPDLALVDYGFVYHLDDYPQDDITWFLLEKK